MGGHFCFVCFMCPTHSIDCHLRERYARVAIVLLMSAAAVMDRIVGLEMGADDYVPKPFGPRVLAARVKIERPSVLAN